MSKLTPILNISAFAETFFTKCAEYGLESEQAYELLCKQSDWKNWLKGGLLTGAGIGAKSLWDAVGSPFQTTEKAVGLLDQFKNIGVDGAVGLGAAGMGAGGLAWLMRENAQRDAKAKQDGGGADVEELRKAFAPANEPRQKSINTASQGYNV